MAKTNNPDIFLVKPTWVTKVINGSARTVWYLKMLTAAEREALTNVGTLVTHTTKAGRKITIVSVSDVSPGSKHSVYGEDVTIPEREGFAATVPTGPSKDEINSKLHAEAHAAGMKAGEGVRPAPMLVVERANAFDDNSPVVKAYEPVMEGVCGYAWVNIRPATCSFARWLSKNNIGHSSYHGGWDMWVGEFGQSMERKEAYARAYAEVLRQHDIKAHTMSRMD
jgi:hypothetical protein